MNMEISASNSPLFPMPDNLPGFYVIIVAGGTGSRMGGDIPKQYRKLGCKTVIHRTVDSFRNHPLLKGLVVVRTTEHHDLFLHAFGKSEVPAHTDAGKERFNSVYNGLRYFSHLNYNDIILIHDAARPFVSAQDIDNLVICASKSGAATLATSVADTMKYENGGYVARDGLFAIQTPQAFHYGLILGAHEKAQSGNFTDDTSMVSAMGHEISMVRGAKQNFKITTEDDWIMAQTIIQNEMITKVGQGFDVHAFDKIRKGSVILCGIDIPAPHPLKGHSDADVALHTITDALLGAIGENDIGYHFPPSDPRWKGMDSAHFLKTAVEMAQEKGASIHNIDLTIICEAPKLGEYRNQMRERVAQICNISVSDVNIKGTTTEKLGFTGRGEGIAAQAIVTITIPKAA